MSELKTPPIAARLSASVLQQAIQGRLVPQDPVDEPASALLERIRKQRAELVKQKKTKAPKGGESRIYQGADGSWYEQRGKAASVCVDEEIPFDIPESWEWTRMGALIELLSGVDLESSQYSDKHEGIPYITGASNFDNGLLIENRWTSVPKRVSHKGDLLLTCKGTVGDMAINPFEEAHIARQVMAVRPIDYEMLSYIEIVLSAQVERIKNAAKGVIPGIERKTILDGLVSLPSIEEQRRIVERINEIMPLIDQLEIKERESDSVDATFWRMLPQSILQQAIEGKLVPQDADDEPACALLERIRKQRAELVKRKKAKAPKGGESRIFQGADGSWYEQRGKAAPVCIDEEIPFDIPESWEWARLNSIVNIVSARRVHKNDWRSSGVPFYRAREIVKLAKNEPLADPIFIDESLYSELSQSGIPLPGDLMVTGIGTIGTTYVVQPDDKFYYKDASVLCFENRFEFSSFYLQLLMRSSFLMKQIRESSVGTTVATITMKNAVNFLIPVPPLGEQQRIVEKVDEIFGFLKGTAA